MYSFKLECYSQHAGEDYHGVAGCNSPCWWAAQPSYCGTKALQNAMTANPVLKRRPLGTVPDTLPTDTFLHHTEPTAHFPNAVPPPAPPPPPTTTAALNRACPTGVVCADRSTYPPPYQIEPFPCSAPASPPASFLKARNVPSRNSPPSVPS